MEIKKAKDLKVGDRITLETGQTKRVTATSNGIYRNSTMIRWKGGWTCQHNTAAIALSPASMSERPEQFKIVTHAKY